MEAAAEDVGLIARFAVQGNHRALRERTAGRPQLLHNADAVVGDVPDREPSQEQQGNRDDTDNDSGENGCVNHGNLVWQIL